MTIVADLPDAPPLHYRGVVLGPSGFAAQGREWLALLDVIGLRPSLHGARLGDVDGGENASQRAVIARCGARAPAAGRLTVHHVLPPHFEPEPGAIANCVITVFETRSLPAGWGPSLARADAVVVPSEEVADAFVAGGVPRERVHAIAVPVDTQPYLAAAAPWAALPPRRPGVRRLLSVFDLSLRKGFDVLLPAFGQACGHDQAELILKVAPRSGLDPIALERHCQQVVDRNANGTPPRVYVLADNLPAAELPSLYAGCDALVLPSRGEGWGRPVHEAMLTGLPVVATRAGALGTLLPDAQVGYPVRSTSAPVRADAAREAPVFAGQHWWEPDLGDLVRQLRAVVQDPAEARRRGQRARAHVLQLCAPDRIAAEFCAVLDRIVPPATPLRGRHPLKGRSASCR